MYLRKKENDSSLPFLYSLFIAVSVYIRQGYDPNPFFQEHIYNFIFRIFFSTVNTNNSENLT